MCLNCAASFWQMSPRNTPGSAITGKASDLRERRALRLVASARWESFFPARCLERQKDRTDQLCVLPQPASDQHRLDLLTPLVKHCARGVAKCGMNAHASAKNKQRRIQNERDVVDGIAERARYELQNFLREWIGQELSLIHI